MGNLVSFTTPKCEATNYHQLSALDIDKQPVDFSSLDGKVRRVASAGSPSATGRADCRRRLVLGAALQVVLVVNVASK